MTAGPRVQEAIGLALELHGDQTRKCSGVPYITHLMTVAALVGEYGGTEDQFIAALLHDAVEDQGGKAVLERIRAQFGPAVAELVWACSDAWEDPKPPWKQRKEAHIARVPNAPREARLILAADKLHNVRAMTRAYTPEAEETYWKQFRGGRDGTLWYYEAMGKALATGWQHPILRELEEAVTLFRRRLSDAGRPESR
jgi:(p)ppGpp synthase/HD superfamily hydrolase